MTGSPLPTLSAAVLGGVLGGGLLAGGLLAGATVEPPWLLVNESRSLPRGLYLRRPGPPVPVKAMPGDVVAAAPPPSARAYLAALGAGPEARLLKRVAAGPGAAVCAGPDGLRWPGGVVRVLPRDRAARPLPAWRGCRRLAAGELLLLGDTPLSFDSRYFGPVDRTAVAGPYRRILSW